jgi:glycosyltransferase involved in cell wall biosynthesis
MQTRGLNLSSTIKTMKKGCIIIPCYNEANNIARVVDEVWPYAEDLEILVVNDASTDQTSLAARKTLKATVIDLPANLGVGGAVQTGMKFADTRGRSLAIKLDGDGQHPPEAIQSLLKPLYEDAADIVVGSRFLADNSGFKSSWLRRIGTKFFEKLALFLTGQRFTDATSGFRAYNRKAIEFMARNYPTFDYPEPEELVIATKHGLRVKEIPVTMRERLSGESTISSTMSVYFMLKVTLAMIFIYLRTSQQIRN